MGQGTAFVYRELGLLVTCDHVFEAKANVGSMVVPTDFQSEDVADKSLQVVRPDTQQAWPVRIVHRNKQFDFAILQFEGTAPPHRYFPAMGAPIQPHSGGFLIGFPAYKNWNLPDQNEQKVLNRTMPHPTMDSFTISGAGSIRPGNSGGPFTDNHHAVRPRRMYLSEVGRSFPIQVAAHVAFAPPLVSGLFCGMAEGAHRTILPPHLAIGHRATLSGASRSA